MKYGVLRRWDDLPGNSSYVEDAGLPLPPVSVAESFVSRLIDCDLFPNQSRGFWATFFDSSSLTNVQAHAATISLDMAIDFLRACSFYKGHQLSNPSVLVKSLLECWHATDPDSYFEYLRAMDLLAVNPILLPHQMPLMNFNASSTTEKVANSRALDALRKSSDDGYSVPNAFNVDFACGVKGSAMHEMGLFFEEQGNIYRRRYVSNAGKFAKLRPSKMIDAGLSSDFYRDNFSELRSQMTEGVRRVSTCFFGRNPRPGEITGSYVSRYSTGG